MANAQYNPRDPNGTDPLNPYRKASSRAVELIKRHEGFSNTVSYDPVGIPTGGWGYTGRMRGKEVPKIGENRSERDWQGLLDLDLITVQGIIDDNVTVEPTTGQRDAMTSWIFNLGGAAFQGSTFLRRHNESDFDGAAEAMQWYTKGGPGKGELPGMVTRRAEEAVLYLSQAGGTVEPRIAPTSTATALEDPAEFGNAIHALMNDGEPQLGINLFDGTPINDPLPIGPESSGVFETLVSTFALENDVWNAIDGVMLAHEEGAFEFDPNFKLSFDMIRNTIFENRPDLIVEAASQEHFDFLLRWHTRELEHRTVVALGGGAVLPFSMLAGWFSPVSLVPFGAGVKTASVLRGTMRGARVGVMGVGVSEAILQGNQEFRTAEESFFSIGAGAFLMGAVGGLGGGIARRANRQAQKQIQLVLDDQAAAAVEFAPDIWYVTTPRVRQELQTLVDQAAGNGNLVTRGRIRDLYRRYGEQKTGAEVGGMLDEERRLILSSPQMLETRNINSGFDRIEGFDAEVDPKVFKALGRDELLDREALELAYDEATSTAVRPRPLTETQQRVADADVGTPRVQEPDLGDGLPPRADSVQGREIEGREGRGQKLDVAGDDPIIPTRATTRFEEEMGIFNGIIHELETLSAKQKPSSFDRARMIYLRRRYFEFADDERIDHLFAVYKRHGINTQELVDTLSHPPKGSLFEQLNVLRLFEEEGIVRSRVDRLILNDAELNGDFHIADPTPVLEFPGIGPAFASRIAGANLRNMGELKAHLERGGDLDLPQPLKDRILGHEAPPGRGGTPIPIERTPALEVAEATWGAEAIPLLISTPQGRILLRSPNPVTHRAYSELAITDYKTTGDYLGVGASEPVEVGIKNWHLKISNAMSKVEGIRRSYLVGLRFDEGAPPPGKIKTFTSRLLDERIDARHNEMTKEDWWMAVTRTLRSSDNSARGVQPEAASHVEEAARVIRREVFGPASKEFGYMTQEFGVDWMNYVLRVYDQPKIRANLEEFRSIMMREVIENWNAKYPRPPNPQQMVSLAQKVEDWIEGILAEPGTRAAPNLGEIMIKGKGVLGRGGRKRVVEVSDETLDAWLQHDLRDVMAAYMNTRLPDLEIRKKFGDVKMTKVLEQIDLWYTHAIANAPKTAPTRKGAKAKLIRKPRTASELQQQWNQDRIDIEAMRDVLRHTYTIPADPYSWKGYIQRAGKALRDINYLRIGGGFGITALGDVSGMVLVNGVSRTMGDLVGVMSENLGRAAKASSLPDNELEALGFHWSDVMHSRAIDLFQSGSTSGGYTALERALARNSKRMAHVSLLQPWTNFAKHVASRGVVSRLIRVAEDVEAGRADPDEVASISRAYMSESELVELLAFQRKYGGSEGDIKWLGIDKWELGSDAGNMLEMKRKVRNAIVTDVDRAVMTPGVGDSPIIMHSLEGKFLFQFKRFGVAYSQKLLAPAMQGSRAGNLIILNGLAMSMAMGQIVYTLKELANKREAPTDVNRIIQEGVVRSDMWASVGEMDGLSSALSDGTLGFRETLGPDTHYSYHGRNYFDNVASHVLGPSYSTVTEFGRALGGVKNYVLEEGLADVTEAQMRSWRRIMPYQNWFGIDWLADSLQNGIESAGRREARSKALIEASRFQ